MDIRDTRILVTGGDGFVGSHIVDGLVESGYREIVVLDNMVRGNPENLAQALSSGRVQLVTGDIRDRELVDRLVARTDILFHQAALRITHCAAEPRQAMEVMVQATFDLLESCVRHSVRRVVAASSASIYGLAEIFPTPEDQHPYGNRTLYGAAKLFNEQLLRSFNDMHGLDYVALRYFNVYGPRMDLHGRYTEVLIRWMERIALGQAPIIFGNGQQTMDFVHVRDVARANLFAARSSATDVAINVGTGTETSLLQLAQALAQVMGRPGLLPQFQAERSVNPVGRRLADISAARESLGYEPTIDLCDGLSDLVAWWSETRQRSVAAVPA
jgi:UDP-glucose 4-epimerase